MKHLTTLLTMAITFTGLGQQMPYNPDANGDDFVGVDDVLGVLGVYDTALMQPDLQCDYEGTDLEQLMGGLFSGSLVLDSLYMEYLLIDSSQVFLPECPDPVTIETVLNRAFVLPAQPLSSSVGVYNIYLGTNYLSYDRSVNFQYDSNVGRFNLSIHDSEVRDLTSFNNYDTHWDNDTTDNNYCSSSTPLPFPDNWGIGSDGLEFSYCPTGWVGNCESFRLIPFWHEAE